MTANTSAVGFRVEVNGADLFVAEQGQGDPLLLVHMGLSSSVSWAGVVPHLAEHFRVITFDQRGHGRSSNPTGALRYEQLTDDIAALIEALDLEAPFVGGWSFGGDLTIQFGLCYPGHARALIVGGTSLEISTEIGKAQTRSFFHVGDGGAVDFAAFAAAEQAQPMLQMLRTWQPGGDSHWQTLMQQSVTMWLGFPEVRREQVARIAEPTLVVAGDRDELFSVEDALRLSRWLPNGELAILPGASHVRPVFDPATFVQVVVDFLQRH
jgi:pimeloyl-ACP methyl ester carboxylesterase